KQGEEEPTQMLTSLEELPRRGAARLQAAGGGEHRRLTTTGARLRTYGHRIPARGELRRSPGPGPAIHRTVSRTVVLNTAPVESQACTTTRCEPLLIVTGVSRLAAFRV